MAISDWGLTTKGFNRPTYAKLLDSLEFKARELFGANASLTVRSPLGLFLRIFAWILNLLFQLIEDVYNSRFIDTAVGASLYNLGKMIGLRLLPAQKASGYLLVSGTTGTRVPSGFLAATTVGVQYVVVTDMTIGDDGTVLCPIRAFTAGPDGNAAPDTIVRIINPKEGITAVTNPQAVDGGRDRETDEQYRDRYYKSVDYAGGVNADAIRAELLQYVEGIYAAAVLENDTDYTDAQGLPPHSIEAIVYGGLDADVAKGIYRRKAAGIQTYGNTSVPVISLSGQAVDILFSRPQPVPVWIMIYNLEIDTFFPEDGLTLIQQAYVNFIGDNDEHDGLPIGEPVMYNRLYGVTHFIPGIKDYRIAISADGLSYSTDNIIVGLREKAVTDTSKVMVMLE